MCSIYLIYSRKSRRRRHWKWLPARLLISTKKSSISEKEPWGEEVEEKEEEDKASKLMWKPQKADPDDLDDIVTLRHHKAIC